LAVAAIMMVVACKSSQTSGSAPDAAQAVALGQAVMIRRVSWTAVEVTDRGQVLPANPRTPSTLKTQGRFVMVHYRLLNNGDRETETLDAPDLIDTRQRHFRPHEDDYDYLALGAHTFRSQKAPPGVPFDCWSIYDVAADAEGLQVFFAGPFPRIDLGVLNVKAPTTPEVATTASSAPFAVDATAAKAACQKTDQTACTAACDAGDAPSCVRLGDILWEAGEKTAALARLKKACQDLTPASGRACWSYSARLPMPGLKATEREDMKYRITRWDLNKTACDLGDGYGCVSASKNLSEGYGTDKDEVKAQALLNKAVAILTKECDSGDAVSCRSLAMLYEAGRSIAKDTKKAAVLYRKACDGGDDIGCVDAKRLAN
jgi:hypothetical protein